VLDSARQDLYGDLVNSEAYRAGRLRKAEVIAHLCRGEIERSETIADLGAGTGIIKSALETMTGKSIIGFDIDASFIVENRRMVVGDVTRLPVPSDTFDFAIMNHLYEHVPDQASLFREAFRILAPGGKAYVSAGSRLAVMEPHYRLPFLSWLPKAGASSYLRWSGRGERYTGIRFLTYGPLTRLFLEAGFVIHDITELAIDELIERAWGRNWARVWRVPRSAPIFVRRRALAALSPQWFFLLEKPGAQPASRGDA